MFRKRILCLYPYTLLLRILPTISRTRWHRRPIISYVTFMCPASRVLQDSEAMYVKHHSNGKVASIILPKPFYSIYEAPCQWCIQKLWTTTLHVCKKSLSMWGIGSDQSGGCMCSDISSPFASADLWYSNKVLVPHIYMHVSVQPCTKGSAVIFSRWRGQKSTKCMVHFNDASSSLHRPIWFTEAGAGLVMIKN